MKLALFDFDGTLTTRDTLLPFLRYAVGTPRFVVGMLAMSPVLFAYAIGVLRNDIAKPILLRHFLGGRARTELTLIGHNFSATVLPGLLRPAMIETIAWHRSRGDQCLLVSASLDVYLDGWGAQQGFAAVLSSRLASDKNGRVDGVLDGGNCFGPIKVQRIREWLAGRRPEQVIAYGDSRGDAEMMAFADVAHWIGGAPKENSKSADRQFP